MHLLDLGHIKDGVCAFVGLLGPDPRRPTKDYCLEAGQRSAMVSCLVGSNGLLQHRTMVKLADVTWYLLCFRVYLRHISVRVHNYASLE